MRRIVFAWAVAFGIMCAGQVSAEDSGNTDPSSAEAPVEQAEDEELAYSRSGGYVGLGGAFAVELFSAIGDQDDGSAIMFRGGYRGYSWLAVEFLGEVLPQFEGTDSIDNDANGFAVTVNAKLLLPLDRFEPFAMAGIGILNIDQDLRNRKDDFVFRGAVGLDFYLTPHWALYGEAAYMLPTGDVSDFAYSTFGGGILFRF
jgi:opacity protein-like surface antigen